MDFELPCCPECGEPLLDDLRDFATESREYEGPFGHVCQWTFRDVSLAVSYTHLWAEQLPWYSPTSWGH